MFKKEAEDSFKCKKVLYKWETDKHSYIDGFKDGAEFGYRKANEWHYMKDVNCYEDLPQNKDVYYAYVGNVGAYDKPIIEHRLGCFVEIEYDIMAYHVIAWKEIELPKEIKEKWIATERQLAALRK